VLQRVSLSENYRNSQSKSTALPSIRLFDLDNNIRSVLVSFLDPINWCRLRETCRDAREWPLPTVDYDFIYFAINNGFDCVYQGVAYTVEDVREAVNTLNRDYGTDLWHCGEVRLALAIIKFDREKHPIAPLMTFEDYQYVENDGVAELYDLGQHYFGVKYAFPIQSSFTVFQPEDPNSDPIFEEDDEFCKFNGLNPKNRMDLEHIGIRGLCCTFCGQSDRWRCDIRGCDRVRGRIGPGGYEETENIIFYSPAWFGDGKNSLLCSGPEVAGQKSWLIFSDTIVLWDKY
jgi:hypothetical protein